MKRYLLDSGILSDFANRRKGVHGKVAEAFNRGHRVGTGAPVVGELLAGLETSDTRDKNLPKMERALSRLTLWTFDEAAAREYAKIAGDLRRRGISIQQIDMQTAAIAFALGNCVVVTKDSDFNDITGLAVENWTSP